MRKTISWQRECKGSYRAPHEGVEWHLDQLENWSGSAGEWVVYRNGEKLGYAQDLNEAKADVRAHVFGEDT